MNAALDQSSKQTITARLKTDGITVIRITADPSTHAMSTTNTTSGAVSPKHSAATDENGRTTWFAVSENDSTQLVALQCDSAGNLLVKVI